MAFNDPVQAFNDPVQAFNHPESIVAKGENAGN